MRPERGGRTCVRFEHLCDLYPIRPTGVEHLGATCFEQVFETGVRLALRSHPASDSSGRPASAPQPPASTTGSPHEPEAEVHRRRGPRLPDGPADADGLTPRQRKVLDVIRDSVERRGYPPSMREIGDAVGLTSTSSVAHQLATLERKGYLRRDPNRPRAVEVRDPAAGAAAPTGHAPRQRRVQHDPTGERRRPARRRLRAGASAASPPAGRSWPSRPSRTSSRSPASSSARASCSCSRSSASR